jgi:signal transduction histidine kinase/ligand-binding sensor domain-containing protein
MLTWNDEGFRSRGGQRQKVRMPVDGISMNGAGPAPDRGTAGRDPLSRVPAFWLSIVLLCSPALALAPGRKISQYAHTAWRNQDGAFSSTPASIAQTADGYVWIGTLDGLVRFDGVRFVPWTAPAGKRLPSPTISYLLGGSDGSLWIGTNRGLVRWKNGELTNYSGVALVNEIVEDPKGTIWISRARIRDGKGPLCEVAGNALRCYGAADGIPFPYAEPMVQDALGNLWIGSSLGLCRWKPGSADTYSPDALKRLKEVLGVNALALAADGSLWVGIQRTGKGLGLQQFSQGVWKDYAVPGMDGSALPVGALLVDRDNSLWIGTTNRGIYRVHDGRVDHFSVADGLSSDSVQGFYQDREGNLWVVTASGIDRFHDLPVATFSTREGLTADAVGSVLGGRDDTVWIGNQGALDFVRDGKVSAVKERNGLPRQLTTALLEDHADRLWVGVDGGLAIYERDVFHPITRPDGSRLGMVIAMTEDVDHNIWAEVGFGELFRIQDMRVQEHFTPPQVPRAFELAADPHGGILLAVGDGSLVRYRQGRLETLSANPKSNSGPIRDLLVDSDGSTWEATGEGLVRWKDGKVETLSSRNGLPCDSIVGLVKDNQGALWLDAECGFVEVPASELEKWWQQPDATVKVRTLDVFDGALPAQATFHPTASRTPDGKLWFANTTILQMVDPSHLGGNVIPPPVLVEQVIADRKTYSPEKNLRLPALTRDIEIDYTALSFVVPQKVLFRYKLEGHDADWQDPQTRRQAFYSDLPPGNYRFRVIAGNNDGVWNETGATLAFVVPPAFFQTTWFLLLCCVTVAGAVWLLYALRLRQVAARMQTRLEERLEERERIARDLHDTLLQGFASASMQLDVANDRLPEDSPVKPLVERVLQLMRQVSEEGRNAIRSLRSSLRESNDLEQEFSRIGEEIATDNPVDFRVIVQGLPRPLHPFIHGEAYRIGREAATNAFNHAEASKIKIEVEYLPRSLCILIRDNGCGIDPHVLDTGREGHWGLSGMRERAEKIGAKLAVLSRAGAGTEVELSIPGKVAYRSTSSFRWPKWLTRLFAGKTEAGGPSSEEVQDK